MYRGIALDGWYHILNAGFHFSAVGASDYPYCRALGDCRTYVRIEGTPTFSNWVNGAVKGQSFFTTGPMLFLKVNGKEPGEVIQLSGESSEVQVDFDVVAGVGRVEMLEIIANGKVVAMKSTPLSGDPQEMQQVNLTVTVPVKESTWIAARAYSTNHLGLPDGEGHTNPIYVQKGGQGVYVEASVDWLLRKLDERIAFHGERQSDRKDEILDYFEVSRQELLEIKKQNGMK